MKLHQKQEIASHCSKVSYRDSKYHILSFYCMKFKPICQYYRLVIPQYTSLVGNDNKIGQVLSLLEDTKVPHVFFILQYNCQADTHFLEKYTSVKLIFMKVKVDLQLLVRTCIVKSHQICVADLELKHEEGWKSRHDLIYPFSLLMSCKEQIIRSNLFCISMLLQVPVISGLYSIQYD